MWLLFAFPLRGIPFGDFGWFGTKAQLVGLVTLGLPLATLVVWARLLLLDREQDEMAADLGAPPGGVVWRGASCRSLRRRSGRPRRWCSRGRWESS